MRPLNLRSASFNEQYSKNVKYPDYEVKKVEKGMTPYHRSVYSFVDDGFIAMGDAACLTKPTCGEGCTSSLVQGEIAVDVISKLAAFLEANGDIGMASPEIRFPDGRLQILGKRAPTLRYLVASRLRGNGEPGKTLREYAMLDCDLSNPLDIQNATGCFMFIRTKLFKELGGFDKRYFMYFEDSDLTLEVNSRSRTVYYPRATVYHEWGRESKKNFKLKLVQINSMLNFFAKWGIK